MNIYSIYRRHPSSSCSIRFHIYSMACWVVLFGGIRNNNTEPPFMVSGGLLANSSRLMVRFCNTASNEEEDEGNI